MVVAVVVAVVVAAVAAVVVAAVAAVVAITIVEDNLELILQTPNGDIPSNISNLLLVEVTYLWIYSAYRDVYARSALFYGIIPLLWPQLLHPLHSAGFIPFIWPYTLHRLHSTGFIPFI
ncbi:hypothetical protein MKX34_22995 [Paenibacillus sp. FSL R5-0636]|uniref:hypothetical protein n=1 Tax=Paenibacillus sp. FSL R5-0636 TaxID=2921652 RepID=UPI0030CC13BE